jgi:hypothetical protein
MAATNLLGLSLVDSPVAGIVFLGVGVAFLIAGPRLMYTEVTQRPRSASI